MASRQPMVDCQSSAELPVACQICAVRSVSVCADLSDNEMLGIRGSMSQVDVPKAQALVHEDEPVENLYVVTSGVLRLSKLLEDGRQQVTGFAYPGDFIGLNGHGLSNFSAEALIDVSACRFPHPMLDRLSEDHPGIKNRLIKNADTELAKAYQHMTLLGQKTVHERVATFFYMVGERLGEPVEGDDTNHLRVPLPMSRRDIADFLAIRLETLSRTLRDLKEEGLLRNLSRHHVVIPDMDALADRTLLPEA